MRHEKDSKRGTVTLTKGELIAMALGTVVVAVVVFMVLRSLGVSADAPSERGDVNLRRQLDNTVEIEYKGATYRQKKNITSILFMGIDQFSTVEVASSKRNGGQADFLRLVVIDGTNSKVYQMAIDRDTMTPITILGVLGNQAGMRTERISLSHGFGDGKEESCQLTVEAVRNLLYDNPIDFYLAMNMDGIGQLNDWLGGVTVTLEDDFTAIDPAMQQGATITLTGAQAEIFVRERASMGIGTNEARMARQQLYLNKVQELLIERIASDSEAIGDLYDALGAYLTTDLTRGRAISEGNRILNYEVLDPIQPAGVHEIDAEGFMQFNVDDESLQDALVEVFYERV